MALFDILASERTQLHQFQQGENKGQLSSREKRSVQKHLNTLLNARRGVLKHLNDYGLPDVQDIYEALPYSQHTLANEVKQLILKYEPRIKNVIVTPIDIKDENCVIRLDIKAFLATGQSMRFNTRFATGGKANVNNAQDSQHSHLRDR
ncbi:type VI secretion system baseplate subunit TssE [Catenovulum sp. SM1970]|uniref:type VI secretion system baseplate subunit TssE n=1 Tax=Marinifaba aquimaris TaxID=2741323 RepID=UPI001571C3CD|nr:type VI secretion system baseplate subunit TssE [Marinifaba aquimaris]NTS77912.1 type VI secretion system baseplate subunit TssE [Marinifaba aquimaris]